MTLGKVMFLRCALLLVLISSAALAADPLELSVLGITGDHISLKGLKGLSVLVTNGDSVGPIEILEISVERKNGDGKFSSFRMDIECPCDAKCKKSLFSLKKSASLEADWDLLGGNHCEKATPGDYRFAVTDRYSEAISGYVYYGVSKEFSIKE